MRILPRRLESWLSLLRVFSHVSDALLYRKMGNCHIPSRPLSLRVREAGGNPLWFRPGTTDLKVLWDTFHNKYHLPPVRLKPDCLIVDLGANVGYTVAHFGFLYPKSSVIAVELDRDNIEIAERNIHFLKPRCKLIHAAVWSANGHILYGGNEEWGFHVLEQPPDVRSNVKKAPARTLDTIFESCHIKTVDYLKVDIEGAEANVLQGSMEWIRHVQSMKIELHPQFNPEANVENCFDVLLSFGFKRWKDNDQPQCVIAVR